MTKLQKAALVFVLFACCVFVDRDQLHAQGINDGAKVLPIPTSRPDDPTKPITPLILDDLATDEFPAETANLRLRATVGETDRHLQTGVTWRVFSDDAEEDGKLRLIGTFTGGDANFQLPSGYYLVHAAFGYAGKSKRIRVLPPETENVFAIRAGGLRLTAAFSEGDFVPSKDLRFEVAKQRGNSLTTIANDISAGELIQLDEGTYRVTSYYGALNSEAVADVRVKADKVTEVTLFQRGAEVTLKLVSSAGGEAMANTSWTVLTPGGDPVADTIASSFPTLILSAGEYIAFASHAGKNFSKRFTIESGVHTDVEVEFPQ